MPIDEKYLQVETKEDSPAKLAAVAGKATKWYLFATEFEKIRAFINKLRDDVDSGFGIAGPKGDTGEKGEKGDTGLQGVPGTPAGVVTTVKSILSTALATQNVAGMVDYINALTPVLVVANNEIIKYQVSDTGQLFELNLRGRSFGVGQIAITDSDVIEVSSGVVNTITINTAVSVDTNTTVSGKGQQGKNVKISNGATAINLTCLSTSNADFVASYTKIGTSTITFLAGTGATLVVMGGGLAVLNGAIGSSALLTRHGNTYYLQLNNY